MQPISICIPTWNRFDLLFKSFEHVINDPRIDSVIVVDDCSDRDIFEKVKERSLDFGKVTLYRNIDNKDCYENKMIAVSFCPTDYCILLDSDNIIMEDYLNRIYEQQWDENTILAPTFAKPHFNYTAYSGTIISKENVGAYMPMPMFSTALNTANFFVNRRSYLDVWDETVDPVTSDSIYFNYCWLKSGRKIHFVKDLEYFHLVHNQSHYQNNIKRTPNGLHETIEHQLKTMS